MKYAFIVLLLALIHPSPGRAQAATAGAWGIPWTIVPSVTIVVNRIDKRDGLAAEAVAFWNGQFEEIGIPLRLGNISHLYGEVPTVELRDLSEKVRSRTGPAQLTIGVRRWEGNIVVALSSGAFVSFTARWPKQHKALVAIRNLRGPLASPNVARNVIAHELGHAIGLGHNSQAGTLMCGRPAPCRPGAYASEEARYFPLTAEEKATLKRLYPANWKPQ